MQEVRVESLERLEVSGGQIRLSANAGSLSIVLSRQVWDRILAGVAAPAEPEAVELEELYLLREHLKSHAQDNAFDTVLERVRCGERAGLEYDLVLRQVGLFAATTGYHFAPFVGPELVARIGACLEEGSVEQAYAIGAVVDEEVLAGGDDNLKCLSIRGRRCTTSRFEMAPELWQVLSGRLGWENVETFVGGGR